MKTKKRIGLVFLIISVVATVILAFFLLIKIQMASKQESYYETLNTLPQINDVEEELEPILVSRQIEVYDTKINGSEILYYVFVDYHYKYVVLYEVTPQKSEFGTYYKWEYVSHRYIGQRGEQQ